MLSHISLENVNRPVAKNSIVKRYSDIIRIPRIRIISLDPYQKLAGSGIWILIQQKQLKAENDFIF